MAELIFGVKFLDTATQTEHNNTNIVDTASIKLVVRTNLTDNSTGESYQLPLVLELDLGYNWEECRYVTDEMFVRIIDDKKQLEKWLDVQGIDSKMFEDKLLKLLIAVYTADNSKYKRYFWTTHNVWLDEWDF